MRILITGANGEIGKEIASQLSKIKKFNLDLLTNKKIKKKKNPSNSVLLSRSFKANKVKNKTPSYNSLCS